MRSAMKSVLVHVTCGLCQGKEIIRDIHRPYGYFNGKFVSETCQTCGAFRVLHDSWANWRPRRNLGANPSDSNLPAQVSGNLQPEEVHARLEFLDRARPSNPQ